MATIQHTAEPRSTPHPDEGARRGGLEPTLGPTLGERALAALGDAVFVTDGEAKLRYLNPAAQRLIAREAGATYGRPLGELLSLYDEAADREEDLVARCLRERGRAQLDGARLTVRGSSRLLDVAASADPMRDERSRPVGAVLVLRDVTDTRRLMREISHQATHDTLTGLLNRAEFEDRLTRLLAGMTGHEEHALLYLDLDGFKAVNDTWGHAAGDAVLREVADVLRARVRERDSLARIGGDEFALVLEHCSEERALRVANKLEQAVDEGHFRWREQALRIGISIGVKMLWGRKRGLREVLAAADRACYAAKRERALRRVTWGGHDDNIAGDQGRAAG